MHKAIRPYQTSDLAPLHQINREGEPGVGAISQAELGTLIEKGICLVSTGADDEPLGFLLALPPEADYASKNYRWFDERYEDYIYVDRIAVTKDARGQGLGMILYEAAFAQFALEAMLIVCEVNTAPPNPASLRFHRRLGFNEVGRANHTPDYAVAYLARRLAK